MVEVKHTILSWLRTARQVKYGFILRNLVYSSDENHIGNQSLSYYGTCIILLSLGKVDFISSSYEYSNDGKVMGNPPGL